MVEHVMYGDMAKHELKVKSCELVVTIYELKA